MKRIINGVTYNTETATEIYQYKHTSVLCTDFRYYEEVLYRTRSGNYFLFGEGEALSPYSNPYGTNGRTGSAEIVPLTESEAREWLERAAERYDARSCARAWYDILLKGQVAHA